MFVNAEAETSGTEAVGLLAALVVLVVAFGTVVAALVPIGLALVAVAVGARAASRCSPTRWRCPRPHRTVAAMIGWASASTTPCSSGLPREPVERPRQRSCPGRRHGLVRAAVVLRGGTVVVAMAALALTDWAS